VTRCYTSFTLKNTAVTSIHRHQTPPQYRRVIHCHRCTVQPPPFSIAPNMTKREVVHKTEVHNVAQRHRRRTEPRTHGICSQNFVPIGPALPEICSWTDRQTHRHTGWWQ